MAEMAERLFDAAAVERVEAAHPQRMITGPRHQGVEHMVRHVGRDIEFPAELADIGHAMGAGDAMADLDRLRRAEGEILVRQALRDQRLQEIARLRPHHRHHRFRHGHIHGKTVRAVGNMTVDPVQVAPHRRRRGDNEELVGREPCHRHISLDMAVLVQELGIDDLAVGHRDIIAAKPLQHRLGVLADDPDLAEAGQVEHAHMVAHGVVLVGAVVEPVLALPAIFIFRRLAGVALGFRQEPVGTLPSADLAETGALSLQPVMDRRLAYIARGLDLAVGKVVGIEKAERFGHAALQI